MRKISFIIIVFSLGITNLCHVFAQQTLTLNMGKDERTALLFLPKQQSTKAPLIFAFHGHGGTARYFHQQTKFEELWPQAIIVYPQGLHTPGSLTDPKGEKTGWQNRAGVMDDRDLKFFDALLDQLTKDYHIDEQRIYAMGHSNGGGFTYLLLAERGDVFAAVAPSASIAGLKVNQIKPKPVMHIMGERDPLVKPALQQRTIEAIKKINHTTASPQITTRQIQIYPSVTGNYPLKVYSFPGGHEFAPGAAKAIIEFFQANKKPLSKN